MPLIPARSDVLKGAWRIVLFEILDAVRGNVPAETVAVVDTLFNANSVELEALAEAALGNHWQHPQHACLPLVSAALQAVWTRAAAHLDSAGAGRLDIADLCPVCGSLPVASVIRAGAAEAGLRYLHCSLCNCEWRMVRAQCSLCGKSDAHAYVSIDGGPPAVSAETCDACHGYLKLLRMDRDPEVDPVADDLASLALDLLLDERGYARGGPNPMLIPGPD
jgi:FdhE protein